jgi:hypothetical protein
VEFDTTPMVIVGVDQKLVVVEHDIFIDALVLSFAKAFVGVS